MCVGQFPVNIEAQKDGFSAWQWSTGATQPVIAANAAGVYTIDVDFEGCLVRDTIVVTEVAPPEVNLGADIDNCADGVELTVPLQNSTPLDNYAWSTGQTGPVIEVKASGAYTLSTNHICGILADEVLVSGCEPAVYVPNVFAPGVLGINARFMAFGENAEIERLRVYNNWGMLMYDESAPSLGWDGTFRGQICPAGVYIWLVTYRVYNQSGVLEKYGDVTLLR